MYYIFKYITGSYAISETSCCENSVRLELFEKTAAFLKCVHQSHESVTPELCNKVLSRQGTPAWN